MSEQLSLDRSRLAAGVWKWGVWGHQLSPKDVLRLIEVSLESGIKTFDHADIYGHYTDEALFGQAMALNPSLRNQCYLVSKCGIKLITENRPQHRIKSYDTSAEHIVKSVENSLQALKTDRLDLLLIHRPDMLMEADEIAGAFETLRRQGKVLSFGVSNFTPSQFELLSSRFPLITNQLEISILKLDPFLDGSLDQCQRLRIQPMAWSPLGSGALFSHPSEPRHRRILEKAQELGTLLGYDPDQILLAWLMKHPSKIIPVLGTGNPKRIQKAAQAATLELSREQWFELWQASTGTEVP